MSADSVVDTAVDTDDLFVFSDEQVKAFDEAVVDKDSGKQNDPPDGKYQVKVMKVGIDKTKDGRRKMNWHLQIISGKYKNKYLFKGGMLDTPQGLGFLKKDLVMAGVEHVDLNNLKDAFEALLDRKLDVSKKVGKDPKFYNVWINGVLDLDDGDPLGDDVGTDDVPF